MRIVLDTNFLIFAVREKIGIFIQLKGKNVYTIAPVIRELEKISKGKSRDAVAAKVALMMLSMKKVRKLATSVASADRALVDKAEKGYVIATQDRELKERVKRAGGKVLYIRQKKYVVFD